MAIMLLQTKWCVLKKIQLETSTCILDSCARLHNYVINEKIIDNEIMDDNQILTEIVHTWLRLITNCGTIVDFAWKLCDARCDSCREEKEKIT